MSVNGRGFWTKEFKKEVKVLNDVLGVEDTLGYVIKRQIRSVSIHPQTVNVGFREPTMSGQRFWDGDDWFVGHFRFPLPRVGPSSGERPSLSSEVP